MYTLELVLTATLPLLLKAMEVTGPLHVDDQVRLSSGCHAEDAWLFDMTPTSWSANLLCEQHNDANEQPRPLLSSLIIKIT